MYEHFTRSGGPSSELLNLIDVYRVYLQQPQFKNKVIDFFLLVTNIMWKDPNISSYFVKYFCKHKTFLKRKF